ncbi:MAG: hypothetical protein Q8O56_04595 [Solirubrobacteraceae bacterium]|nr:hypothetical protein [Solirubrobacteraceae bacterium]
MDEALRIVPLVGEVAERPQTIGQLIGRRWAVYEVSVSPVEHRHAFVVRRLQPARGTRVVERSNREDAMELEQPGGGQGVADPVAHELEAR